MLQYLMHFKQLTIMALIVITMLLASGCSKEEKKHEDSKNHVLRQQMDMIYDAQSVTNTLNKKTAEQDREATELAGHN